MGYLATTILVAIGVWAAYAWFETGLGEGLCDSGDCPTGNRPALFLALTLVSFVTAMIVGRHAWRKEQRVVAPTEGGSVGSTLLLIVSVASVGTLLGVGALLVIRP